MRLTSDTNMFARLVFLCPIVISNLFYSISIRLRESRDHYRSWLNEPLTSSRWQVENIGDSNRRVKCKQRFTRKQNTFYFCVCLYFHESLFAGDIESGRELCAHANACPIGMWSLVARVAERQQTFSRHFLFMARFSHFFETKCIRASIRIFMGNSLFWNLNDNNNFYIIFLNPNQLSDTFYIISFLELISESLAKFTPQAWWYQFKPLRSLLLTKEKKKLTKKWYHFFFQIYVDRVEFEIYVERLSYRRFNLIKKEGDSFDYKSDQVLNLDTS